jgi:hypothetical protein
LRLNVDELTAQLVRCCWLAWVFAVCWLNGVDVVGLDWQVQLQQVVDELRPKAEKWDEIEAERVRREIEAAEQREWERLAAVKAQCKREEEEAERKRKEAEVCFGWFRVFKVGL